MTMLSSSSCLLTSRGFEESQVFLTSLNLRSYRNHRNLKIEVNASPVVIVGNNGVGKTNVLEAISLLSPGRGIRGSRYIELIRRNQNSPQPQLWCVYAEISKNNLLYDIGTELKNEPLTKSESGSRIIKINGNVLRKQSELLDVLTVIWQTPALDQIFVGSTADRRKFLSRLVYNFFPDHADLILGYEYYMRERLKILKGYEHNTRWLKALEEKMAVKAAAIAIERFETINFLSSVIEEDADSAFPKARLIINGEFEDMVSSSSLKEIEEEFKRRLFDNRRLDTQTGRTNAGIHRSDLLVYHGVTNHQASICSTGEQKALITRIILAEARAKIKWRKETPIVLLDEAVSHLDETRRLALFAAIEDLGLQAFLTGTDRNLFEYFDGKGNFLML